MIWIMWNMVKGIVIKDTLLVIIGAFTAYLAQRALFNKQHRKDIEEKEEKIILDAINFTNCWSDQVSRSQNKQDFKELEKILDEGFLPRLGLISFQLRRLKDKEIWQKFQKTIVSSVTFTDLLQTFNMEAKENYTEQFNQEKENWLKVEREFTDHCAEYLKLKNE